MEDELHSKRSQENSQEERGGGGKDDYATGTSHFQQFNDGN